jgi:mono/diheme cytochrome c family protein
MKAFLLGIIFTILVIILGGYYVVKKGYMNTQADQAPPALERKIAMTAVDASIERRAVEQKNPIQPADENLTAGAKIYADSCAGCHGLPSNPNSQFGRSFNPPVPQFFTEAPDMPDYQNFYVIKHGLRWTGMPSWAGMLNDTQIWTVVGFLGKIGKLPPAAQKALEAAPAVAAASPPPSR